jgi:hypothetical protein
MKQEIHTFANRVTVGAQTFSVAALGQERDDGSWIGWLEFRSLDGAILTTDQETSQPNREAVAYWAAGLEPIYLEGAFERAVRLQQA